MKKLAVLAIFTAILAISLTGCPNHDEPPVPGLNSLVLYNYSYKVAVEVYLTPVWADDWGVDQMPGDLYPDESFRLHSIPDDTYDLLVYADDGSTWELYSIDLYGGVERSYDLLTYKSAGDASIAESSGAKIFSLQLENKYIKQ